MSETATDTRTRELGLCVLREMRNRYYCTLTAVVVYKTTTADVDDPWFADRIAHPSWSDDFARHDAAQYEGLRITGNYDGRHFFNTNFAYRIDRPIHADQAEAAARVLRTLEDELHRRRKAELGPELYWHRYPELVETIAEIIGASFAQYSLDSDPSAPITATDIPGLAAAFARHTPRDETTVAPPF